MRTPSEIASIARYRGEVFWITNLQNDGEHELVEALFDHHETYDLVVISNCMCIIEDMHGEQNRKHLTIEMLEKMSTICDDLDADETSPWHPDEFRALSGYFVQHFDEWPAAMDIIRFRNATTFKEVIGLLPQSVSTEKSLLSGVL